MTHSEIPIPESVIENVARANYGRWGSQATYFCEFDEVADSFIAEAESTIRLFVSEMRFEVQRQSNWQEMRFGKPRVERRLVSRWLPVEQSQEDSRV